MRVKRRTRRNETGKQEGEEERGQAVATAGRSVGENATEICRAAKGAGEEAGERGLWFRGGEG